MVVSPFGKITHAPSRNRESRAKFGGGGLCWAASLNARPDPVVEEVGDGLNHRFYQADGEGGAPVLGDGVADEDRNAEVHHRIGAGLEGEAHSGKVVLLRMVRKYVPV